MGESLSRQIWARVLRTHRVSLDQMIILEPVLSETIEATLITVLKEAVDEAVRRGVPMEAAKDFVFGHLNVELAIVFKEISASLSDGALVAIERARLRLFQPDWKAVFEPASIRESVHSIVEPAGG